MAKFLPGPLAAEIRGSIGGTTFSQNAAGAYIRRRSVPTISTTAYAQESKEIFTNLAADWRALTDGQRQAWAALGEEMTSTDSLGQNVAVTGLRAFMSLNGIRRRVPIGIHEDPPTMPGDGMPAPPMNLAIAASKGATPAQDSVELTWDFGLINEYRMLLIGACHVSSPARKYVRNLLRLITIEQHPATSPLDITDAFKDRFGDLVVGNTIHVTLTVGHLSGFYCNWRGGVRASTVVVQGT